MKNILLTILFTFSVSLLQADDKHVIIKKIIVGSEQEEKNVDVNVEVEDNQLTLTITQDGEENVYTIDLNDENALENLEKELGDLDVDVKVMDMISPGGNDDTHIFFSDDLHNQHVNLGSSGYLGVQIQDITDQLRDYFKVKGAGGVLVSEVMKESPAENAGLETGDIINRINDVRISDTGELTQTIRKEKPESKVDIIVVRKGREKSIKAILGSSENSFSWYDKMGNHPNMGMKKHKMMMKKIGHICTTDCGDDCSMKGQKKIDVDIVIPDGIKGMMKKKMFMGKWGHGEELEKLKKELEELRKELQKQSDS